jgi:1-acyl-sn-glycerol-3-phosphate acyltransferase
MSASSAQTMMDPLYGFSHGVLKIAYEIAFHGDVFGLENLPPRGGYIIASNHASYLDPLSVGLYLPQQVAFFARDTLWRPGLAAWWLDGVGGIPVDRDGGTPLRAIKRVLQALSQGRVVILFPEGTRTRDGRLQEAKPGVGLIACRTGMPVVPARVFGSFEALGREGRVRFGTPVSVRYGPALAPSDYDHPEDGKERYDRAAQRIMAAIAHIDPPVRPVL